MMYVAILVILVGGAVLAESRLGFPASRGLSIGLGLVLVLSGLRWPRILYHTTRYMRILSLVNSDTTARTLMIVMGMGLLLLGTFGPGLPVDP